MEVSSSRNKNNWKEDDVVINEDSEENDLFDFLSEEEADIEDQGNLQLLISNDAI